MQQNTNDEQYRRREFLTDLSKVAGAYALGAIPGITLANQLSKARLTVKQVFDLLIADVPGSPFAKTVDQLRSGTMEQEVNGIVTTMFPTIEVIQKTAKAGANCIIAHETPFYNNEDETEWLKNDDAYHYKVDLLNKHKIAVLRFHDYWHAHRPDGIVMGNLVKLGWDNYYDPSRPRMISLPKPMLLQTIVTQVKDKFAIPSVRVVGNLKQPCMTVYMAFGYMDSKRQIAAIDEMKPDLILSGETREWETVERVRDGLLMGQKTNLMVLSHSVSEEAGMEYAAKWLQPKVTGTKVTHIPSGNPFQFV